MTIDDAVSQLVSYAQQKGLIEPEERIWAVNTVLDVLRLDGWTDPGRDWGELELAPILETLLDDARARGVLTEDGVTFRDLLDTELMGRLTPRPAQVRARFRALYARSPREATDWYYQFSQDTNYIRRDRIARDMQWKVPTEYGDLDITINLSKPEKDPRAIAAARVLSPTAYPRCQLCAENEGYAGRIGHPARQNHRVVPVTIAEAPWFLQYSPYVYYNEHCIVFNREHVPMKIDRACFGKLLDFVAQFPHYFVGSNADLPIVGGSILAHDHFQGGHYSFPMERAPIEEPFVFPGFEDVRAGIVKWPMSVIRIGGPDRDRLIGLADQILQSWRSYTDEEVCILAETGGEPHNTITPIARRRGEDYELDLVLRNNLTTPEHPLGLYHPHAELHHIKKENIGLIEVMGLAVLPARLKGELAAVAAHLADGTDLRADPLSAPHADWAETFRADYPNLSAEDALDIVEQETGKVFAQVLTHAGVYKRDAQGREAFRRFLRQVRP
ncbi:UDP-glucose--hexose-1-phosphate uridylyltransferase [Pseudoflavonifractor sp. MSJ-37]|uniref:UDP-glucose--hexose-1-phosphate uridylyltransferase n=1 Tax=Pseudoflavonifractor sp. MSJ-37 TaxID=2841531 RepID=UPI001C10BE0F|nr:UDP-glucose--hexose-1-phosphate uridylyltransferase [Pseudoflavonifractor sp. MSJ-37]MBU5436310.1 UDP-glucose--hexose-1-phosphate uridylyltransferase [Pseudoflavonifractor sp. MSJ-37]